MPAATLHVVATPIGNLGDFSPRAVETLNFYGREYDHPGWTALKP